MIQAKDKVFVQRGISAVNFRTAPSLSAEAKNLRLYPGAYLGVAADTATVDGAQWVKLANSGRFVWVKSANLEEEYVKGETVFARPGRKAVISADVGGKTVVFPRAPRDLIGSVNRVVRVGSGRAMLSINVDGADGELYVDPANVLGARQLVSMLNEAASTDAKILAVAQEVELRISELEKRGLDLSKAKAQAAGLRARFQKRQKMLSALSEDQGVSLVRGSSSSTLNALPVWAAVAIVSAVVIASAVIGAAVYKALIQEKPHEAAAFDYKKIEKLKTALASATSQADIDKAFGVFQSDVKDYGDEQFQRGADSKDPGIFGNLFNSGKTIIIGLGLFAGYQLVRSEMSTSPRSKRR